METFAREAVSGNVPFYRLSPEVCDTVVSKINTVPLLHRAFIEMVVDGEITEAQCIKFAREAPSGDQILKEFVARRIHPFAPLPHDIKVIVMEYLEGMCHL
jgi:hypothetical protein